MPRPYQWLLFDVDNTLLDFSRAAELAFYATLADLDLAADSEAYSTYQIGNHQVWAELEAGKISQDDLKKKRFQLYLDAQNQEADPGFMNERFLANLVDHSILIEGCVDLLNKLQDHYRLAIVTNGLKAVQKPRLLKTGVLHYFETVIVSEEIGFAKPQNAFFEITFQQIGQPKKSDAIIIGDSLKSDIKGGIDFGIDTCWFNPAKGENNTDLKPTFEAFNLPDLQDLFL